MSDQDLREFLESIEKSEKEQEEYGKNLPKFINELTELISEVTYQHFIEKKLKFNLKMDSNLDKNLLNKKITYNENITYYIEWIFEELTGIMLDFTEYEIPTDRVLLYKKIEYPVYDEKWVQENISHMKKIGMDFSTEEWEKLYNLYKNDAYMEEHFVNFKKLIHKAFKKLALKYYPDIPEISGAGIREIDYMLYRYMLRILPDIYRILQI
jgi:hypothetical protein